MVVKVTHGETMVKRRRTQKKKERGKRNIAAKYSLYYASPLFAWEDEEEKLPMVKMELVQIYYRREAGNRRNRRGIADLRGHEKNHTG